MSSANKTVYIVFGPTASGKTSLSISLAEALHTEIISADSRQCYRELSIGVARPAIDELKRVPHHFIASHSIHEKVDVAVFEKYALFHANQIFQNHDQVVLCGGTGLYVKAFCEGIDEMPQVDGAIREQVEKKWQEEGLEGLRNWLEDLDPLFLTQTTEPENPVRLMRALEVKLSSGRSLISFQQRTPVARPFQVKKILIDWPRAILYNRINQRVDQMIEQGLVDEARALYPFRQLNALQTVGYQELFNYFDGMYSLDEAVEKIRQHTRNYAKRQLTWFRKQGVDITIPGEIVQSGIIPWTTYGIKI